MTSNYRPPDTRWVHDLFEGTLTSETKCLTCENVSQRDEAFLDLSVDLTQHSSVTACLRNFSEEEMLCERNKFHCDVCGGLQEAEKRMKIKRLPRILALHLKRFKYTEDLQRLQKLFHKVVYPYHLRLFNTTDDAEDPDRLYELYAVVVHIGGGPYHGHYVSVIKTQDRGWLLFDDESVEPVDKEYVRNFFGDASKLACAYVLFYQHTTTEAVKREQETERRTQAAKEAAALREIAVLKETSGLGIKTNGVFMNGLNHVKSAVSPNPVSPTTEEDDHWENLDKAVTEPPSFSVHPHSDAPLQPIGSPLSPTKGEAQSKKERKAAEKEKERLEKARLKALDMKRKEDDKKQAADTKTATESSKVSKLDENHRIIAESAFKEGGFSGSLSGSLSRFRTGSKSISKRPKLWGLVRDPNRDEAILDGDETPASTSAPEKAEKSKNPFSTLNLRKKKSNMQL
ncbi:ubiquitin carboxyl-terminal hydrolase creB [Physcia stellaris]|nr:ubiquitin carboxyl-terminal hydrolase creB [Physcia stellaris]